MNKLYSLLALLILFSFASCSEDDGPEVVDSKKEEALKTYADIVLSSYEDSYATAEILDQTITGFLSDPTSDNFEACKLAWKEARIYYGQTEAYRFYGGPIDDANGPEGLLNAWPMDENFIDYVQGNPDVGLINDPETYPTISAEVLMDLNESISETSIFTGYHAIEFLLWGQDLSASGPGNRAYTDYVTGEEATADNATRRGQYLEAVSSLLLDDLSYLVDQWKEGGDYRAEFLQNTPVNEAIGKVFTALGELSKGELGGERMFVAVDTQDQENEHSCFSDNTHIDIQMNFQGIKNVYYGQYIALDGSTITGESFAALAATEAPAKAETTDEAFLDTTAKINAIPVPFDQAIVNDPETILAAVDALSDLSDRLADVALELDASY